VVHIEQSTIQGNTDTAAANTVTSNDTPFGGGGIANQGVLTLDATTVSGNTAGNRGGGFTISRQSTMVTPTSRPAPRLSRNSLIVGGRGGPGNTVEVSRATAQAWRSSAESCSTLWS
jgi:hypothetical protein